MRSARVGAAAAVVFLLGVGPTIRAAAAEPPVRVVLDGTFQMDRATPSDCFVSVPPGLTGTIDLTIDYEEGTVVGRLEGSGSGEDAVPASCFGGDPLVYRAALEFSGNVTDSVVDPDGYFEAVVELEVDGSGSYSVPGKRLICHIGPSVEQPECPLAEVVSPQYATVSGVLSANGPFEGEVDWYTHFCMAISSEGISYTKEGCPRVGTWTAEATDLVLPPNANPIIDDVAMSPVEPSDRDAVSFTASAHDPNGDLLTYAWTLDGVRFGGTGASAHWPETNSGDHWVELVVADGRGGQAEASFGFNVTAAGAAEEQSAVIAGTGDGESSDRPDETQRIDQENAAPAPAIGPSDDDGAIGLTALILVTALVLGAVGIIALLRRLFGRRSIGEAAQTSRAHRSAIKSLEDFSPTHLIKAGSTLYVPDPDAVDLLTKMGKKAPSFVDAPLPTSIERDPLEPLDEDEVPDVWVPATATDEVTVQLNPDRHTESERGLNVVLRTGAKVYVPWESLEALKPKAKIAKGNVGSSNDAIDARNEDGSIVRLQVGHEGHIEKRFGDNVLFRFGDGKGEAAWVKSDFVQVTEPAPESL